MPTKLPPPDGEVWIEHRSPLDRANGMFKYAVHTHCPSIGITDRIVGCSYLWSASLVKRRELRLVQRQARFMGATITLTTEKR